MKKLNISQKNSVYGRAAEYKDSSIFQVKSIQEQNEDSLDNQEYIKENIKRIIRQINNSVQFGDDLNPELFKFNKLVSKPRCLINDNSQ